MVLAATRGTAVTPEAQAGFNRARQRGAITLEEIVDLASNSPIDMDEARELSGAANIELTDNGGDPWEHLERLADHGPNALRQTREGPADADELAAGDSATLYLGEISRTPLLTAEEEIQLAQE